MVDIDQDLTYKGIAQSSIESHDWKPLGSMLILLSPPHSHSALGVWVRVHLFLSFVFMPLGISLAILCSNVIRDNHQTTHPLYTFSLNVLTTGVQ